MLNLALTGGIASGKSSVSALFSSLGAIVIDADVLAREVVAPGTDGFAEVVATFGSGMLASDGTIDRAALRRRVFANAQERDALNAIVHPAVSRRREARLAEIRRAELESGTSTVVISDIPLLFEVGLEHAFDGVILVDSPPEVRLARLLRDRGLPASEAQAMMSAQWPSDRKRAGATWVIDNDGSREQLAVRVAEVWRAIHALNAAVPSSHPPTEPE